MNEANKKLTLISTPQQSTSRILVEDTPSDHGQGQVEIKDHSNDSYMIELFTDSLKPNQTQPIIESQHQIQEDYEPNHSAIILDKSLEFDDTHLLSLGPETQFARNSLERNGPLTFGFHSHDDLIGSQRSSHLSEGQNEVSDSLGPTSLQIHRHSSLHSPSSNQNITRHSSNLGLNQSSSSFIEPDHLSQYEPSISARLDVSSEGFSSFNSNHANQEAIQSTISPPLSPHQQNPANLQSFENSRLVDSQRLETSRIEPMEIPLHSTCPYNFTSPNPDTSLPIIPNHSIHESTKTKAPLITPPQSINNNQIFTSNSISNHFSPIVSHQPISSPPPLLNSPTPIKDRSQDPPHRNSTSHSNPSAPLLFNNLKNPPVFNTEVDSDIFDLTGEVILGFPASQSQSTQDLSKSYTEFNHLIQLENIPEHHIPRRITRKEEIILAPDTSDSSHSHSDLVQDTSSKKINRIGLLKEFNEETERDTGSNEARKDKHLQSNDLENFSIKSLPETRSDESSFEPVPPTQINEPMMLKKATEKVKKNGQDSKLVDPLHSRDQNLLKELANRKPVVAGPSNPIATGTSRSTRDLQSFERQRRSQRERLIPQLERSKDFEHGQQIKKSKTRPPIQTSSSKVVQGKRRLMSLSSDLDEELRFPSSSIPNSHLAPNPSLSTSRPLTISINQRKDGESNKRKQKRVMEFEFGQESDQANRTLPETRSDESSFEPAPPTQINELRSLINPPEHQLASRPEPEGQNTLPEPADLGPSKPVARDTPRSTNESQRSEDKRNLRREKSIGRIPTESESPRETNKSVETLPETTSEESSFEPAPPTQINVPIFLINPPKQVNKNAGESKLVDSGDLNILREPVAGPSNYIARDTSYSTRDHQRFDDKRNSQREKSIPQLELPTESDNVQQLDKPNKRSSVRSGSSSEFTQRRRKLICSSDVDEEIPLSNISAPKSHLASITPLVTSKSTIVTMNDSISNHPKHKNVIGSENGQEIDRLNSVTVPVQSSSSNRMSQRKRKRSQIADVNEALEILSSSLSAPESELEINESNKTPSPVQSSSSNRLSQGKQKTGKTVGVHERISSSSLSALESELTPVVANPVQRTRKLTTTTTAVDSNKRRKKDVKVTKTKRTGLVSKVTNRLTGRKAKVSKANDQKKKNRELRPEKKEEEGYSIKRFLVYDDELNGYRGAKLIQIKKEGIQVLDDSGKEKVCKIEELRKYEIKRGDVVKYLGNRFKDIEPQRTGIRIVKSVIKTRQVQEDRIDLDPEDLVLTSSVIDYRRFCDQELLIEEDVIGIEFKVEELLVLADESDGLSDRRLDEEVIEELKKLIEVENEKEKKMVKSEACISQMKMNSRNLNRVREGDRRDGSEMRKIFEGFGLILTELKSPIEVKKGKNDRKVKGEGKIQSKKERIELRLKSNGGKIINRIDELIEFSQPFSSCEIHSTHSKKKRKVRSKSDAWEDEETSAGDRKIEIVKKTSEFDQVKVILLLTDEPIKTLKYWLALSLGIPCVSNQWVIDSCEEEVCLDWKSYLLPSGYSKRLQTFCFGNQRQIYQKNQFDLRSILDSFKHQHQNEPIENQSQDQDQPPLKLFHDQTFYCLVKKSNKKEMWYENVWWILCCLGVKEIKSKSIENFKEIEQVEVEEEINEVDYVLIDDELEFKEEEKMKFTKNSVVNLDWIKESLIFGKVI
ncbi:hypothetical protein DFH28DRAFT_1121125 [Melampsora americana]|nr:hypothetical protein DFH28DRAFT_1121125 [Melampsora americana]